VGGRIYLAFVPWVLFTLITRHDDLQAAAIVGLVAAVAISVPSFLAGRPKVLEVGSIVAFVALRWWRSPPMCRPATG
jgi:hypothetical protein